VLPLTPDGDVILVRQLRPAVREDLLEVPAGLLDVPGEDALACATRELLEETGYAHVTIGFLARVYTTAGFSNEVVHLFWAITEPEPRAEPEPGIRIERRPFTEMVAAARDGGVADAKTALALLLAEARGVSPVR
jgi:ADP-ribose pyrophosphatase